MKIKDCFWRKNIFGDLRRSFLGINCDDVTWKGLKKDHALEWGNSNQTLVTGHPYLAKYMTQEEEKNEIKLVNSTIILNYGQLLIPRGEIDPK